MTEKLVVAMLKSEADGPELLTQKQVIERVRSECGLAISSRTVNAWVQAGMPHGRAQRRKFYVWRIVLDWLMNPRECDGSIASVRDSAFRRRMKAAG